MRKSVVNLWIICGITFCSLHSSFAYFEGYKEKVIQKKESDPPYIPLKFIPISKEVSINQELVDKLPAEFKKKLGEKFTVNSNGFFMMIGDRHYYFFNEEGNCYDATDKVDVVSNKKKELLVASKFESGAESTTYKDFVKYSPFKQPVSVAVPGYVVFTSLSRNHTLHGKENSYGQVRNISTGDINFIDVDGNFLFPFDVRDIEYYVFNGDIVFKRTSSGENEYFNINTKKIVSNPFLEKYMLISYYADYYPKYAIIRDRKTLEYHLYDVDKKEILYSNMQSFEFCLSTNKKSIIEGLLYQYVDMTSTDKLISRRIIDYKGNLVFDIPQNAEYFFGKDGIDLTVGNDNNYYYLKEKKFKYDIPIDRNSEKTLGCFYLVKRKGNYIIFNTLKNEELYNEEQKVVMVNTFSNFFIIKSNLGLANDYDIYNLHTGELLYKNVYDYRGVENSNNYFVIKLTKEKFQIVDKNNVVIIAERQGNPNTFKFNTQEKVLYETNYKNKIIQQFDLMGNEVPIVKKKK